MRNWPQIPRVPLPRDLVLTETEDGTGREGAVAGLRKYHSLVGIQAVQSKREQRLVERGRFAPHYGALMKGQLSSRQLEGPLRTLEDQR